MFIQLISRKWDGKSKGNRQSSVNVNNEWIFVCSINCSLLYSEERKNLNSGLSSCYFL